MKYVMMLALWMLAMVGIQAQPEPEDRRLTIRGQLLDKDLKENGGKLESIVSHNPDGSVDVIKMKGGKIVGSILSVSSMVDQMRGNMKIAQENGFQGVQAQRYAEQQQRIDRAKMDLQNELSKAGMSTDLKSCEFLSGILENTKTIIAGMDSIEVKVNNGGGGGGDLFSWLKGAVTPLAALADKQGK